MVTEWNELQKIYSIFNSLMSLNRRVKGSDSQTRDVVFKSLFVLMYWSRPSLSPIGVAKGRRLWVTPKIFEFRLK